MSVLDFKTKDKISEILTLTDEQIEDILYSKDVELKISKLYFYLNKESFLEASLKFSNSNVYYAINVLEKVNNYDEVMVLDIGQVIVLAENKEIAKITSQVAIEINELQIEDAIEFVKLIANANKNYQAEHASNVAADCDVLRRKNVSDLMTEATFNYLIECLNESNETEITKDTKIIVKTRKQPE